ncbi:hypothetical protein [Planococcus salinus]|uniref:Glycosyltransferase family 1 protein n=1 Tax=Planococcus salinus TaxID=1848460 RepID=A0A3M8P8U9_9BACL|nr:hypothetical protein [Planococcus salinus]RNF39624.1 hypothetical protein EEX84_09135 [Planococcus salinus]
MTSLFKKSDFYPRILIISNNPFSTTSNNGKTLASFFKNLPSQNISQLYFNTELPDEESFGNYYRITDMEILKSTLNKNIKPGSRVSNSLEEFGNQKKKSEKSLKVRKNNFTRILRECLWNRKYWNTKNLNIWLEEFQPQIIFFCAGDSEFAYEITDYVRKKFNSKLVVYVTDDYILPRKNLSVFWYIRRKKIKIAMGKAIKNSDLFISISSQMKKSYEKIFNKTSMVALNMSESMLIENFDKKDSDEITLVYAGGLHFKRYLTLNFLAKAIEKYNKEKGSTKKATLKIFSTQTLGQKEKELLEIEGASEFCGPLKTEELKIELNKCDIPVHVESFDKKSIESTRLSISTKIPEYLSLGKPVLAIGPKEVASMKYLKESAYCITSTGNISKDLYEIFNNNKLRETLAEKSINIYEKNHNKELVVKKFISSLMELYEGKPN